jgi:hypothetical protein
MTDVEAAAAKEENECKQNGGSSCIPNRYCEWCNVSIRWELFKYKKMIHLESMFHLQGLQ